jgi:GNAT superfamily N-acetyltransferase
MPLTVTTDHAVIADRLDKLVARDPVRATLLGTLRRSLEDTAWAAMHGGGIAVRSSADYPIAVTGEWPADLRTELVAVLRELPGLREISGPLELAEDLVHRLVGDREVRRTAQRLFQLTELDAPTDVPGRPRPATDDDRELVREWYTAFMAEAEPTRQSPSTINTAVEHALSTGVCWLWLDRDDQPVSLAAQRAAVAGSARIGPVYTPPALRGRGYASAVTAAATRHILEQGAVPVLFTDLANPTSNKIYQRMGYRPVEDRVIIDLG